MSQAPGESHGVSLVIPAWNEERRLSRTLDRYLTGLQNSGRTFEVIVVSDGSTDRTASIALGYADRNVRLLEYGKKLGKGRAVVEGIRSARYEDVGFVDADGPIPVEDILRLVDSLVGAECAIASRSLECSIATVERRPSRRALSRLWSLMVRGLFLLPIRDYQCGAKFFRKAELDSILPAVQVSDWAFDVSLLYHLHSAGYQVREVAVTWTEGAGSKFEISRDVPSMLVGLLGLRLMNLRPGGTIRHGRTAKAPVPTQAGSLDPNEDDRASESKVGT